MPELCCWFSEFLCGQSVSPRLHTGIFGSQGGDWWGFLAFCGHKEFCTAIEFWNAVVSPFAHPMHGCANGKSKAVVAVIWKCSFIAPSFKYFYKRECMINMIQNQRCQEHLSMHMKELEAYGCLQMGSEMKLLKHFVILRFSALFHMARKFLCTICYI